MKKPALLLLPLLLGACAGKVTESHEYLLAAPALAAPVNAHTPVLLKPVTVAPYLDQEGIVLQTDGAEVHVARKNRWAEPLDAAVDRYLQVAIANAADRQVQAAPLSTDSALTSIQVRIHQLHGSTDGRVRLVAEWSVTSRDGEPGLYSFDVTTSQQTDGYGALVDAHALLLDQLAVAIAGSL